jgi:thioredoxin-related protein
MKLLPALALAGLSLLAPTASAHEGWIADFDEAVKLAKAENKDLFVDFTGSDWCGWCIRLNEEVFAHEEFLEGVKDRFVLVALDYPRSDEAKAKVPNPERNSELQQKYGIQGFPTILLMNSDGLVYGQTGYREGGPVKYVEHLNGLVASGRAALEKVTSLTKRWEAAEGAARDAMLGEILDVLETLDEGSPFTEQLIGPAKRALAADPDNAKGLKKRAVKALIGAGVYEPELLASAMELDPKNAEGLYESAVMARFMAVTDEEGARDAITKLDALNETPLKDKDVRFNMNFTAARWAAGPMQDTELAKKYARIAKGIGSDDERMIEFLDMMLAEGTEGGQ